DNATNNRANVNISGGADIAQYYISLGYYNETGQFKTEDIDSYNSTLKYDRFNFTSNLNVNVSPTTKLDFGLNGFLSNYNEPARGKNAIFNLATQHSPHTTPVQYSNGLWPFIKGTSEISYKEMYHSESNNSYDKTLRSTLRVNRCLELIIVGLSATGLFGLDVTLRNRVVRSGTLSAYYAGGRDGNGGL